MSLSARSGKMEAEVNLAPFKELLLRTCGHSFEKEREQALSAALCRRMAVLKIDASATYLSMLLRDGTELLTLTELLTVNETYFFREPEHLNLVVDRLLPEFMAGRARRPIRILSAGCSTGEEPYSLAIMLRERFGAESGRLFDITGVDIDSTVISAAKQGVYGKGSFRGVDQTLLERYFEPYGEGKFRVGDTIRNQVGFEVVNLLGASYPQRMQLPDIILYRNVSIYFPGQVQREIFGRLAELLAAGGCLLVGATETFHHDIGILSLVRQESLFYYLKTPPPFFEERRTTQRRTSLLATGRGTVPPAVVLCPERAEERRNRLQGGAERPRRQPHPSMQADVGKLFDEAIGLAHNRQYDKALALLDVIIQQDVSFVKAYSLKGSLLLSAARYDEARTLCETILERDPLCLEACLMLGMIARQKGDDEGASRRFRAAIYLDASCWPAHFYAAEINYAQRDEKRARSGFETALKILGKGALKEHGQAFFPLLFNAEQFVVICRHKLSLLDPQSDRRAG